jgi:hypothetical protein
MCNVRMGVDVRFAIGIAWSDARLSREKAMKTSATDFIRLFNTVRGGKIVGMRAFVDRQEALRWVNERNGDFAPINHRMT